MTERWKRKWYKETGGKENNKSREVKTSCVLLAICCWQVEEKHTVPIHQLWCWRIPLFLTCSELPVSCSFTPVCQWIRTALENWVIQGQGRRKMNVWSRSAVPRVSREGISARHNCLHCLKPSHVLGPRACRKDVTCKRWIGWEDLCSHHRRCC